MFCVIFLIQGLWKRCLKQPVHRSSKERNKDETIRRTLAIVRDCAENAVQTYDGLGLSSAHDQRGLEIMNAQVDENQGFCRNDFAQVLDQIKPVAGISDASVQDVLSKYAGRLDTNLYSHG